MAAVAVLLLVGVVGGWLLELMARVLATKSQGARVAATAGLMVGIQGALLAVFGAEQTPMQSFLPTNLVRFSGVNIRVEQLVIVGFAAGSTVVLSWWLARARSGVATAGAVDDPDLLALAGINPTAVRRGAWMIGTSFAAASGMLLGPIAGLNASVLTFIIFYAFGAAAVGAFRSLPLTYAGGIAIGVGAALLDKILGDTTNRSILAIPSTLPILVLFVGLMVTRRSKLLDPDTAVVHTGRPSFKVHGTVRAALLGAGLVLLVAIPQLVGTRTVIYSTALCYSILFLSLNLLVRMSGQISLCQMSFAAVGGVAFAKALSHGVPWPLAVLLGGIVALPVGALVAIPAIRLSGIYLAIGTFGFGLLVQRLVFPTGMMFGAAQRSLPAPRPDAGWLPGQTETGYYYVVLVVAALCGLLVLGLERSRLGRLLRALGDAPVAVDSHGTNTNSTRLLAFAISAFLAGIAGAVLGPITQTVGAPQYDFSISLLLVAVVFMSGRFVIFGAAVAAALYTVVPGYTTSLEAVKWLPVLFGAGAVIGAMIDGFPLVERLRTAVDQRRSSKTAEPEAELPLEEPRIASEVSR
jgi:ABC-type branched-subunit amino acid transport system permease subunit